MNASLEPGQPQAPSPSEKVSIGTFERFVLLYSGVLAPVFAHALAGPVLSGGARYQTGLLKDKLGSVLAFESLTWIYPLAIFSMIAFASLVVEIHGTGRKAWTRFGLQTGLIIGLGYHAAVLMQIQMDVSSLLIYHAAPLASGVLLWAVAKLLLKFISDPKLALTVGLSILFGASSLIGTVLVIVNQDSSYFLLIVMPFALVLYGSVIYNPLLLIASYGWMIRRVHQVYPSNARFTLLGMMCWTTWLGGFFAATRFAVLNSLESYARLPLTDPGNCFIATAACRGHPRLVNAQRTAQGGLFSSQLQHFKAFELTLRCCLPTIHRPLRRLYNHVGPALSTRIRSRWTADLCYLMLKPAEWGVMIVLICLLGPRTPVIRTLYRSPSQASTQGRRQASER